MVLRRQGRAPSGLQLAARDGMEDLLGKFGAKRRPRQAGQASRTFLQAAEQLPRFGGVCVQAEDEMSALGMVIGASFAGVKAMTSSSGPGISLMSELIGLASTSEIPCVMHGDPSDRTFRCARSKPMRVRPIRAPHAIVAKRRGAQRAPAR